MADALVPEWLNENSFRAFPLREAILRNANTGYKLADDVFLDAQLVYTTLPTDVSLNTIQVLGDVVTITIGTKVFTASKAGPYPQYVRNADGSLLVLGVGLLNINSGIHTFTNVGFEHSVSYEFGGAWLGVDTVDVDYAMPMHGDIELIEGYQMDISFSGSTINLTAGKLLGVPVSCEIFGNNLNDCGQIISYINGVGPTTAGELKIVAGGGIVVFDDPPNHRIFVGLAFSGDDVCREIMPNPEQ